MFKTFKIFKKQLAYKLIDAGNVVIDVEANKKVPSFKVWIFKDTLKLREDITKFANNK